MKKFYLMSPCLLLLFSCALITNTSVGYVGAVHKPTQQIDVFVDESAIKNAYEIIGKGYIDGLSFVSTNAEVIQTKAVAKAKQKGADAILIKDYYISNTGATAYTTINTDSISRGLTTSRYTQVQQTGIGGFNIWFLKYK